LVGFSYDIKIKLYKESIMKKIIAVVIAVSLLASCVDSYKPLPQNSQTDQQEG
jgi:PBP1b-binding outer membrane lipoprotein LpoB